MQTYSVDCVRQSSDALDLAANFVARFEEAGRLHAHADARRGAGGDDSTGLEGHALRKLGNDMVNVEDLQAGESCRFSPLTKHRMGSLGG